MQKKMINPDHLPSASTSAQSSQNYTISMRIDPSELELDIDDLEGIIQQLDAISRGWGMDFDKVFIKEEQESNYTWTSNGPSTSNYIWTSNGPSTLG